MPHHLRLPSLWSQASGKDPDIAYDWGQTVIPYSRGKLSHASDKLVAISGIARLFALRFGTTYIAGIWQEDFLQQMLWKVAAGKAQERRIENSRVPSWSWASVDNGISFGVQQRGAPEPKYLVAIEDFFQNPSNDRYQDGSGSRIRLRSGALSHCRILPHFASCPTYLNGFQTDGNQFDFCAESFNLTVNFDTKGIDLHNDSYYTLPIAVEHSKVLSTSFNVERSKVPSTSFNEEPPVTHNPFWIHGLIVKRNHSGSFVRVGAFLFSDDSLKDEGSEISAEDSLLDTGSEILAEENIPYMKEVIDGKETLSYLITFV